MKLDDHVIRLRGDWILTAYEGDIEYSPEGIILNPIVWRQRRENLITSVGKGAILDRLFALGAVGAVTHTGIGTSATAAAVGNTSLTGAVYKVFDALPIRTALAVIAITTYGTSEGNISINEAALSVGAGTTLLNRLAPIGPFAKSTAVSLQIQTTITQA